MSSSSHTASGPDDRWSLPPLRGARLHLIGIAGRGMAPMAIAAQSLGAEVSGCDRAGPELQRQALAHAGIPIWPEHDATHVDGGVHVVATSIAPSAHPEMVEARRLGILHHRTDLLAAILRDRPGAGITGSHGKGTVTALAAAALQTAGLDPLAVIGAHVPALGGVALTGTGPTVAEVDDSDTTLRRVSCDVAVVTNLDADHPHLPFSLAETTAAVGEFVAKARRLVILGRSPRMAQLRDYASADVVQYGRDFGARTLNTTPQFTELALRGPGGVRARTRLRLLGPASPLNASLAFATAIALGADAEAAAAGLEQIDRIDRRLEPIGERDGIQVFDDFGGKHPANVRAGIDALRSRFPGARVVAVFEPFGPYLHRWGRRYARALSHADLVIAVPPAVIPDYPSDPADDLRWWETCRVPARRVDGQEAAVEAAMGSASDGDVVVFFAQANRSRAMARDAVAARQP